MAITLLIMILLVVALLITTWIYRGRLAKSTFMLISSFLAGACFLSAWHAWGEPPRSIPGATGFTLGGLLAVMLAFWRDRRP